MNRNLQRGFAIIEVVLILVIVGIIAFVAWRVIDAVGDADTAASQVNDTIVVPDVPEPQNAEDLDSLQNQLNNTTIDDNTETTLNKESEF